MDTAIAADATVLDLVDLIRAFHDQRTIDAQGDLVAVSLVVDRWETISRYATELVEISRRHSERGIVDLACLAVAKANKLPLVTGVADLAGIDPTSRSSYCRVEADYWLDPHDGAPT